MATTPAALPNCVRRHPVPVFGPAAEAIAGTTHPLAGGDRIELPELDVEFEVLDVAGHTRGHVAYYRRGSLFCGDTVFRLRLRTNCSKARRRNCMTP